MDSRKINDETKDPLHSTFQQGEEKVRSVMTDVENKIKQGKEQLKTIAADVDKKLHDNPWPIVAGVAIGCILLGFVMGSNKKN